jgi:hypothetical protein
MKKSEDEIVVMPKHNAMRTYKDSEGITAHWIEINC